MLRRSHTAVLEKSETFNGNFETEPYEGGWASEAIWFVRALELTGEKPVLRIFPQISPDGLFWTDKKDGPMIIVEPGLQALELRNFGGWLRLRCCLEGRNPTTKVLIYLSLKE
ncbi:MAG: hypothetical protein CMJ18_24255 [Phycisphaeraceae bacterium]|nr:hypothetical protein [Phycisphaeraceae bacterium]